jgi:hypothetical protein
MTQLKTDPYLLNRQLDDDDAEEYRSEMAQEDFRKVRALVGLADYYVPSIMREARGHGIVVGVAIGFATSALVLFVGKLWVTGETLGWAMVGLAVLMALLSRSSRKEQARIFQLFTDPFLDARVILTGRDFRAPTR